MRCDHQLYGTGSSTKPGIDEFSREYTIIPRGQKEPDLIEFTSLRLVYRHGECAVMCRQCRRVEWSRRTWVVARKPGHQRSAFAPQANANVAVEQVVAVTVLRNQQQATVEVAATSGSVGSAAPRTGKHLLNLRIQNPRPLRSLAHRRQDP